MMKKFFALLLLLGLGQTFSQAFIHPGIPLTLDDLNYVKARLAVQPWKSGWDALQADPQASTNYIMGGPLGLVSRTPNINQPPWRGDMTAVYKLALRWYYLGDTNYAIKATAIFDAWATTQTNYGGAEAYLDIGDYVPVMIGGAEILRSTYPGWTALNTLHATNYFQKVIRPPIGGAPPLPVRGANQGMTQLKSMLAIAVFCDDTNSWNQCLFAYRNDGDGILDTAPLGMVGDTGRDAGHWGGQFNHFAWTCAVAWAQGVDLFSEQDNRLAKCAEYFSRFDQANFTPYVPFGSIYGLYPTFTQPTATGGDLGYRTIIQTAYETRKGMSLPWTDLMTTVWGNDANFQFLRLADTSTAIYSPLPPLAPPAAYTNWTDTDIGGPAFAGSTTLSNGVWTIKGGGADVNYNSTSDQFHFAYRAVTNDFIFVARVLSETNAGTYAKAGLMVRDSLSASANFADVYMMSSAVEAMVRGAIGESHGDQVRNFPQTMPYWLKVERRGPWIGRYISPDGINWQPINYAWTTMSNGVVYVGLMACAYDNTKLMTATMDNVAISGVSGPGVAPFTPTSLVATAGKSQAMLSWIAGAGATYCNVKRATSSGGPYTTIASNYPATTYTDIDLTNGTTCYYVVSGTNAVGESSNSVFASVTPDAAAAVPAAPTGLTVFAADSAVDLSWTAVTNAVSYNVKRSTSPGGPFTRVFYGTACLLPSFTDRDVTNGVTYYYVVDAVNYFGESTNQVAAVSGTPQQALVWTGAANSTWDVNTTTNWATNNIATTYQNGRSVQFDDTAFNFVVSPSTTVMPASVLFNNSVNLYTLNTTGIGGTAVLVKRGTGELVVNATQSYTGGSTFGSSCQLTLAGGATLGTGVATVNATLKLWAHSAGGWQGALANGFFIADAATLNYIGDHSAAFNGPFTGGGELDINAGGHATTLSMSGNNSAFTGTINLNSGPVMTLNTTSSGSSNAVWNLGGSGNRLGAFVSGGGTFYLGEVSGNVGNIYNVWTASANTATFVVGNNNTDDAPVFGGTFIDNGNGKIAITKQGANTQTFLGTNNYAGLTTIAAGELIVTSHAISAGNYTVNNGGTLGVLNLNDGHFLAVSNLTLAAGSGLEFQNVASASEPLINASNLMLNGSCTVTLTGFSQTGVYPLINYSGNFTGSFANFSLQMPAGFSGVLVSNAHQVAVSVTAPPPFAPTGLTASPSSTRVVLNWPAATGATSYNVKRATTSGGPYTNIAIGVIATTYADTNVTIGTRYYYVVSAVNSSGESGNSPEASALVEVPMQAYLKFDEISGSIAADSTGNGWNGTLVNSPTFVPDYSNNAISLVSGSSQYVTLPTGVVYGLTNFTIAAWVKQTTIAAWARVFDFGSNTTTYMFLAAWPGGSSSASPRFAIKVAGSAEQQINGTTPLTNGVWQHVGVTLKGSVGILYVNGGAVGTNSSMTFNPTSLGITTANYIGKSQFNDPYFNGLVDDFRIYNDALNAGEMATFVTPLPAPTNLIASAGNNLVTLKWNSEPRATSYNVMRSLTNGGPYSLTASITTTNYTDTGLMNDGTTYFYVVNAMNAVGQSTNSTQVSATMPSPPPSPTGVTAAPGNAQVALGWNASSGATNYFVKQSLVSGGAYTTIRTSGLSLTYTNTGLSNGTVYYYVVSASNSAGESTNSAEVSARPVSTAPTPLASVVSGSHLQFTWPADHTGWQLQAQTNSLGTNWVTVANSSVTNQMLIPISPANGCVFFRLVYP